MPGRPVPHPASESSPTWLIWLSGGSCDGCSTAALGASDPGIEDLLSGRLKGLPELKIIHPFLTLASGEEYLRDLRRASANEIGQYVLILEGSIADEQLAGTGSFSRFGTEDDRPVTTADWLRRLAPHAAAIVAIGSCATWGGIPAARGTPTGAMGLQKFLGPEFVSKCGLPVINLPGCAPPGDAFIETIHHVLLHISRVVPLELDAEHRPSWLYAITSSPKPANGFVSLDALSGGSRDEVGCPLSHGSWMKGVGGCTSVGGACVGCTAPDFADHYLGSTLAG